MRWLRSTFAVLFRAPRADVAHPGAQLLTREREQERELRPVIDLDLANLERARRGELAEERQAGVMVLASVRPQHPQPRTVVDRRVLEPFAAAARGDRHVDLHRVARALN
jgi:hypothetical protein